MGETLFRRQVKGCAKAGKIEAAALSVIVSAEANGCLQRTRFPEVARCRIGARDHLLRKHGVSLEETREIFDQAHLVDRKSDDPEQFRAIGWTSGRLCSVIFEIRRDSDGEFYRPITAWKATKQEEDASARQI